VPSLIATCVCLVSAPMVHAIAKTDGEEQLVTTVLVQMTVPPMGDAA